MNRPPTDTRLACGPIWSSAGFRSWELASETDRATPAGHGLVLIRAEPAQTVHTPVIPQGIVSRDLQGCSNPVWAFRRKPCSRRVFVSSGEGASADTGGHDVPVEATLAQDWYAAPADVA